jgi:hypothetical protein
LLASSDFIWKDHANAQDNSKPYGEPMSNSRVLIEKPAASVSVQETYSPALATDYTVQDGDSWVGLARKIGLVDPGDLIDFNFPGTKEIHAKNAGLDASSSRRSGRMFFRFRLESPMGEYRESEQGSLRISSVWRGMAPWLLVQVGLTEGIAGPKGAIQAKRTRAIP